MDGGRGRGGNEDLTNLNVGGTVVTHAMGEVMVVAVVQWSSLKIDLPPSGSILSMMGSVVMTSSLKVSSGMEMSSNKLSSFVLVALVVQAMVVVLGAVSRWGVLLMSSVVEVM